MQSFLRYLVVGSDELYLPKSWLADKARIGNYVGYTRRQLQQGSVVKNVAAKRREAFWQARASQRVAGPNVATFTKRRPR